jgi:uncharacterized protein
MHRLNESILEVRNSKHGKGLFTKENILKGMCLCKVSDMEEQMDFASTLSLQEKESHALQIDIDRYSWCAFPFLYCNHSCKPNCGINDKYELIALQNIRANEELTWDYSTSMLERHWIMHCNCGEKDCRKIISDFDLLPEKIQSQYLQKNIVFPFIVQYLRHKPAKSA